MAPGKILLHKEAGWGFSLTFAWTLQQPCARYLYSPPHKFSASVAMFQSWIPGFDPRKPLGLNHPVWITLHLLPLKHLEFARAIVEQIGRILDEDKNVTATQDPKFCVELETDKGWIAMLELPNLLGRKVEVVVNYDDHMCCTICYKTGHRSNLCPKAHDHRLNDTAQSMELVMGHTSTLGPALPNLGHRLIVATRNIRSLDNLGSLGNPLRSPQLVCKYV